MGPALQSDARVASASSEVVDSFASLEVQLAPLLNPQEIADADEWLKLDAELTPLASKFKRRDELRATILSRYTHLAGNKAQTVNGTEADIWISECDNKRTITERGKRGLQKLWGLALFRAKASFNLSQLPDPKDQLGEFTSNARNGPRHLKALPRLKPAA